ncbi:MAG: molybdenum cofactor guanylyltransferase MobA [Hyphomicrobiales bacterium]|nr:molybdenum cofactor guanylyltransferase MobA [Hyphomicrobiales bacterium]
MPAPGDIATVILAGGQGIRLGGGDKPLRTIAGKPMFDHVLERLRAQVSDIAISANGDPQRLAGYGLPVIPDDAAGSGPLAGILSSMRWARARGAGRLLTVAGDTPFLPVDLARRLGAVDASRVAVASSGGRRHPVFALWPVTLESDLAGFLATSGTLSVMAFLGPFEPVTVDFPFSLVGGKPLDPFFNVNTPEDLAEAEALAAGLCA